MKVFQENYSAPINLSEELEEEEEKEGKDYKLRGIQRTESKNWVFLGQENTKDIGRFFDGLSWDASIESYAKSSLVTEFRPYEDLVGPFRKDPRATAMTLEWRQNLTPSQIQAKEEMIQQQTPIYRVTYLCHGYNEWQIVEKSSVDEVQEKISRPDSIPTE